MIFRRRRRAMMIDIVCYAFAAGCCYFSVAIYASYAAAFAFITYRRTVADIARPRVYGCRLFTMMLHLPTDDTPLLPLSFISFSLSHYYAADADYATFRFHLSPDAAFRFYGCRRCRLLRLAPLLELSLPDAPACFVYATLRYARLCCCYMIEYADAYMPEHSEMLSAPR